MAWENINESADRYSVNSSLETRTGSRGGTREGGGHPALDSYAGGTHPISGETNINNYSVVGIHATNAKQAADNLVSSANRVMNTIDSIQVENATLQGAVKGEEMENAIRSYIDSVKLYCQAVVSDIKAFADKLYEVSAVWESSQANFATNSVEASRNASFSNGTTDFYTTQEATDAVG